MPGNSALPPVVEHVDLDRAVVVVLVYQLSNIGGNTFANLVAGLNTQNTGLRIPTGLLTAGQAYVFRVTTYSIPGLNFAKTPYFLGPTTGFTDIISGMMQP